MKKLLSYVLAVWCWLDVLLIVCNYYYHSLAFGALMGFIDTITSVAIVDLFKTFDKN